MDNYFYPALCDNKSLSTLYPRHLVMSPAVVIEVGLLRQLRHNVFQPVFRPHTERIWISANTRCYGLRNNLPDA